MENLHTLDEQTLLEMLMAYTPKYTQMIAERDFSSKEFAECKKMVECIQQELAARHPTKDTKPC